MRLIIKDYLNTLKEKNELDFLLCDLLYMEGYTVDTVPKSGNRQYGVDIRAHNSKNLLFMIVKQGNIDRNTWDSGPNSIRQSLDEIYDVQLNNLSPTDSHKKIKIITATNGIMDETIMLNWNGYQENHSNHKNLKISFEFWNIDEIANQVLVYLANETLFPEPIQSDLRKALYFMEERDYKPCFYERIIDYYINKLQTALDNSKKATSGDKRVAKQMIGMFLSASLIANYAHNSKRYKIGISIFEYLLIRYWRFLLKNNLLGKKSQYNELTLKVCKAYENANKLYFDTIRVFCEQKEFFPIYNNVVERRLMLYEIIGYLSTYAYYLIHFGNQNDVIDWINTLLMLLNNHPEYLYAPYDNCITCISVLYRLLLALNKESEIKVLLEAQCNDLAVWFRFFHKFPAPSSTYKEAVDIENNTEIAEYNASGFWGYSLLWINLLDYEDLYNKLNEFMTNDLKPVAKCIWILHPDEELLFYDRGALNRAGEGVYLDVYNNYHDFCNRTNTIYSQYKDDQFSFDTYSFKPLELIICRYYNYPPRIIK